MHYLKLSGLILALPFILAFYLLVLIIVLIYSWLTKQNVLRD